MILHGSGKPKLILDYGGASQTTIELPYCESLIETFEPEIYQQKLYNGTITSRIAGWWYRAKLSYQQYLSTEDLQLLGSGAAQLFTNSDRGVIRLYPYSSSVYYVVELAADQPLILQHRPFNVGLAGIELNFIGTTRLDTIDVTTTS